MLIRSAEPGSAHPRAFTSPLFRLALVMAAAAWLQAAAAPALAGEAHLYLAPYAFDSRFTGDGRVSGGSTGTDFDLENTLGVDPQRTISGLDGFVKFFGSRIDFGYSHGSWSGDEKLADPLVFNGTTYGAGEKVRSEFDMNQYRLMYGFDFGLKIVNVGFLVGGHYIDVDAKVKSSATGSEEESLRAPVPGVGVSLGIHPISQIAIHAEVSGFSATAWGVKAKLIDGFAGLHYLPIPKFAVLLGYRYFLLDAEDKDQEDKVNLTQRGPYAGIALHL